MSTRVFTLGEVLSVTTGVLLTDIGNVYGILNFLTDDNLFTHQLPRACRECGPYILAAHPQLASVDTTGVGADNFRDWLARQVETHGDAFALTPMDDGIHDYRNPVSEAVEMVGKARVIAVNLDVDND
jgi:hypothetical protein